MKKAEDIDRIEERNEIEQMIKEFKSPVMIKEIESPVMMSNDGSSPNTFTNKHSEVAEHKENDRITF